MVVQMKARVIIIQKLLMMMAHVFLLVTGLVLFMTLLLETELKVLQ